MAESSITQPHFGHSIACPCVFGQSLTERWGARVTLILAGTITSTFLKFWMIPSSMGIPLSTCFLQSLVYSTCIGLEFFYSFHLFSERISRQAFPLNWFLLLLTVLISALIGFFTGGLILVAIGANSFEEFTVSLPRSLRFSLLLGLIFGIGFFLYESLKRQLEETTLQLRTKQLEEERARKLAIAAQLSSLESRVRPHFLFNTLNSISALIREEPAQAEKMVERLSSMLRFSLDSHQRNTVMLRDEVKIVTDYLEIEKARFGERLRFSIDVPASLGATKIPPFAIQTLIENSIKHALSQQREGIEIQLRAFADGDTIQLEVRDDGPGFSEAAIGSGHGLDNLRAHLYALFGDQATLELRREGDFMIVNLTLKQ